MAACFADVLPMFRSSCEGHGFQVPQGLLEGPILPLILLTPLVMCPVLGCADYGVSPSSAPGLRRASRV